jgi:hypothetical protein
MSKTIFWMEKKITNNTNNNTNSFQNNIKQNMNIYYKITSKFSAQI